MIFARASRLASEITGGARLTKVQERLLLPVVRGRDLSRWSVKPPLRLIYPYDAKARRLLSWRHITELWPALASYLQANRKTLERRRSLRGGVWYSLVEPRFAAVGTDRPRCLISELALWPTASIPDPTSSAILGGAGGGSWLVFPDDTYDVYSVVAYLNSVFVFWLLQDLAPVRQGGWLVLEQSTLGVLLIPEFLSDSDSFARQEMSRICKEIIGLVQSGSDPLASPSVREKEARINSIVLQALGLSENEARHVLTRATKAGFRRRVDAELPQDFALDV